MDTGCFYVLATVNNPAMNRSVQRYLFESLLSILLDVYLGVELPDLYGNSMFNFYRVCFKASIS